MQGRLSPQTPNGYQAFPITTWRDEFHEARSRRLEHIEWIVDRHAAWDNPLLCCVDEVRNLIGETDVKVVSVCGDILMDHPLDSDAEESLELTARIFEAMGTIGATHFVLPCVDNASLMHEANLMRLDRSLPTLIQMASRAGIQVALEADLPPRKLGDLMDRYSSPYLGINYDSGNSSALGYNLREELSTYADRVKLVHIKDRRLGGVSTPLGTGDAEISSLVEWLSRDFQGPVTMQVYRDGEGRAAFDRQMQWLETLLEEG